MIRDSDGTVLSDEITKAGYGIYSTICIIRDHNAWAKENQDKLQQSFLMTQPKMAESDKISIELMADFFDEQFRVNDSEASMKYWQVYDRTTNDLVDASLPMIEHLIASCVSDQFISKECLSIAG